jgi:hypothetical protein
VGHGESSPFLLSKDERSPKPKLALSDDLVDGRSYIFSVGTPLYKMLLIKYLRFVSEPFIFWKSIDIHIQKLLKTEWVS